MRRIVRWNLAALALAAAAAAPAAKRDKKTVSALDRYVREAAQRSAPSSSGAAPGSLFTPGARLADLARDPRASQTDDIVTILVADRASAVSRGATKTQRQSSAKSSVGALLGVTRAAGPLASLASLGGESQLDGQGSTSRETALTTTLSARVTQVLPNGYLVVEGQKENLVNSEHQTVTIRGVVRPTDLGSGNLVRSERLAQLEIRVNGKGVVGDAVRRPFFLYRLLLGLLPL